MKYVVDTTRTKNVVNDSASADESATGAGAPENRIELDNPIGRDCRGGLDDFRKGVIDPFYLEICKAIG
jgi:hypothetical protein